jgi:ADP-heptose:LPS heptosyltransferase
MKRSRILIVFIDNCIRAIRLRKIKKSDVIVKVDGIGDFVIFQKHILDDNLNGDPHNLLVLNILVKPLVSRNILEKTIFIDGLKFRRNIIYRFSMIYRLAGYEARRVINFNLTKDFWVSDSIVFAICSKNKIGSDESYDENWSYPSLYSQKISLDTEILHEIDRLKFFYNQIYQGELTEYFPIVKKRNCFLIVGAGDVSREWPLENYMRISIDLINMGYNVYVIGGPKESLRIKLSEMSFPDSVKILAGMIDLSSLSVIFETSDGMVIGSDTGAMHMAIHAGLSRIFVISNGNNWYRFMPYSDKNISGLNYLNSKDMGYANINDISPDYVINLIKSHEL